MRAYLTDRNKKRLIVLGLFVALMVYFRHLVFLLVFFVVFQRVIGTLAESLHERTRWNFRVCVLVSLLALATALALSIFAGVETLIGHIPRIRHSADVVISTIHNSALYQRYGHGHTDELLHAGREHLGSALQVAENVGRDVLYVFVALVFAVVFLLEREELENWREHMAMDSVPRILLRYVGHVSDAIAITLKLQVIVAIVNAVITLPVLLALRLPGIPALVLMLLVTGLIPVVGGPAAGVVLMVLAYITRGPVGLVVFLVSTFVLHKIESYYLNPRLTAKHVKLPGFVIIMSLVLFEHAFGLAGVFLSFPTLYVAAKIREGWIDPEYEAREEEEAMRAMRGVLPHLGGFRVKPVPLSPDAEVPAPEAKSAEATPREPPPAAS